MSQFEPDFLSNGKIAIFSISRIQSAPTLDHIKAIDKLYPRLICAGIEQVYCISLGDFVMFDHLAPKLSTKIRFVQDRTLDSALKEILNKKGNTDFLKDYWHFACVINNGQVEQYIEEPFTKKICPDPKENFYKNVSPGQLLAKIQS